MTWLRPRRVPGGLDGPRSDPNRRPAEVPVTLPAGPVPVVLVPPRVLPAVPILVTVPLSGEVQALPLNSRRAWVMMSATLGGLSYYARPGASPVGSGIAFEDNGKRLILTKEDYGDVICEAWYVGEASGAPAPPDLYVLEGYYP